MSVAQELAPRLHALEKERLSKLQLACDGRTREKCGRERCVVRGADGGWRVA